MICDDDSSLFKNECIQDAFLVPASLVLLSFWAHLRLRTLSTRPTHKFSITSERSTLILQWTFVLMQFGVCGFATINSILPSADFDDSHKIRWGVNTICWGVVLLVLFFENRARSDRGWEVRLWWLIHGLLAVVHIYWDICLGVSDSCYPENYFRNKLGVVTSVLSIILAGSALTQTPRSKPLLQRRTSYAELFDETAETQKPKKSSAGAAGGGEKEASWASCLIYSWLTPLLKKGMENPLQQEDLFEMDEEDHARHLSKIIEVAWNKERALKGDKASIFPALTSVFGRYFLVTGMFKFANDMAVFTGPVLIRLLVEYFQNPNPTIDPQTPYFYAAGLFLSATCQSLAIGLYFHRGYRTGARVRTCIQTLVYRKAFLLDPTARQSTSVGAAVNLMSVDASRLAESLPYMHLMWSSPLQLVIAVILLYSVMSYAVFVGIAAMILLMPINAKVAQKQMQLNRQIMQLNDKRGKVLNEVLQGIRIIKYFAWETEFERKAQAVRTQQLALMWSNVKWSVISIFLWACSPLVVALVTFDTFVLAGGELNAGNAFAALALFNVLRFPLNSFPMIINLLLEGQVSIKRITKYLLLGELDPNYHMPMDAAHGSSDAGDGIEMVPRRSGGGMPHDTSVLIENGTFWWMKVKGSEEPIAVARGTILQLIGLKKPKPVEKKADNEAKPVPFFLRDINFVAKTGTLVCVTGPTGCGKSTLLAAILGQLTKESGKVGARGRIAYEPQQAWVQNATVRENILFGEPFDEERYKRVLFCCALEKDLEILPAGDKTEIGENGINLSGGQKARVCLARACYAEADVFLLDDPLSAVDVHVSRHLFEHCIMGLLKDKTRVLVTHHTHYFPAADHVVVMSKNDQAQEGRIIKSGSYADCMEALKHEKIFEDDADSQATTDTTASEVAGAKAGPPAAAAAAKPAGPPAAAAGRPKSGAIVGKEEKQEGVVKFEVWMIYMRAMGWTTTGVVLLAFIVSSAIELGNRVWLSLWSVNSLNLSAYVYLGIYSGVAFAAAFAVLIRAYYNGVASMKAAKTLHDRMLIRVLRAPTKFFDTTPTGRILNRFVQDQNVLDTTMRQALSMLLMTILAVLSTLLVVSYVSPLILIALVPLGAVYYYTQRFFRASSRELKRLDSISKSPVFANFSETLNGVATIMAFGAKDRFMRRNEDLISTNVNAYMINNASNRWLGIRLEGLGNSLVTLAAFLALYQRGAGAGFVGLSLTSALEVTSMLNWLIRTFTQTEAYMVSTERIQEYSEIEVEAPAIVDTNRPPKEWPDNGKVEFRDVRMRYRDGLEPALNGVSFVALPGQKIGIVGRTGAGKSSLAVALFRLVELMSGSIVIDSYDIGKIGLDDLRSKLAIIPQDPVLFTGTVRSNLDPFDFYDDDSLWQALERVHLRDKFAESGLAAEISENGSNLSVGQRQLLCMARALLRHARVLVMDEATASVDMELDRVIQDTIATEFRSSTVLTIAHRLSTVMACDRVLVMGQGEVLEFGKPNELASTPGTHFHTMVSSSADAKDMLS